MTATRILRGLYSVTKALGKGLGLAGCIYVGIRDHVFTQRMAGLDNCFLQFPFGYTCNNLTYWNPDFHIYSQASIDTWENTSSYLIPLVGAVFLIDTAINYYYSSQLVIDVDKKSDSPNARSILVESVKSCINGSAIAYVLFDAYREALPVFNEILRAKIDKHYLPPSDSFCFRLFNEEACDTFNTYSWILISSFVINGAYRQFIKYRWDQFSDWTQYAINEAAKGFKTGCKVGVVYVILGFSPIRDFLYSKKAFEYGHPTWAPRFPDFGFFDCTPSPEFDDKLHGFSVGEGIKVTLLYSGPAIVLICGSLNAGYKFLQAFNSDRTVPSQQDLETGLIDSLTVVRNRQFSKVKIARDLSVTAITMYSLNYLAFSIAREKLTYQNVDNFTAVDSSFRDASNQVSPYFRIVTLISTGLSLFASIVTPKTKCYEKLRFECSRRCGAFSKNSL